jgi:hypothetical protein
VYQVLRVSTVETRGTRGNLFEFNIGPEGLAGVLASEVPYSCSYGQHVQILGHPWLTHAHTHAHTMGKAWAHPGQDLSILLRQRNK